MGSWIKRQKVGNKTITTNLTKGSVRVTVSSKKNKSSGGPSVALSQSTKGKSYRTETWSGAGMTKRTRTTQFKQPKALKPKKFKTPRIKKSKLFKFRIGKGSGAQLSPVFWYVLCVIGIFILLMVAGS